MELDRKVSISFSILDKKYTLSCSEEESDALQKSAQQLEEYVIKMQHSMGTQYVSNDRLLVAVAVNLIDMHRKKERELSDIQQRIHSLTKTVSDFDNDLLNQPN